MSKMISVAQGFQYSVNIGYDINHDDKLSNFIPTKSALMLLEDILRSTDDNSTDRARVLVGAYGKGKSHLVLTILSILMRKDWNTFRLLKEKVEKNSELNHLVQNYYESGKKLLPVVINGSNTSMQQSFLLALQKALLENDLMQVMPETNYQAAIKSIKKWEIEYPDTFERFKELIKKPVNLFINALEEYDIEAYSEFEKLYPKLTSGSVFNPFLGFEVAELYESVGKCIEPLGYSGIFVVYDEFSKFLEANIKSASVSDTKMLQDFAEKCNRSNKHQLHIMLISHKEISNYIDKLPKQKVDGWRGVSERFKHIHLNNNFTQTYEIISSVIIKEENLWEPFKKTYAQSFNALLDRYSTHSIFSDIDEEECDKVIKGCYPLHPVTTFILPRLSERVAQNERTLFTFLSADGTSTLSSFLREYNDDSFCVVTPDMIFDYFEPLFLKESYTSELYKNYLLAKVILEKLDDKSLESKIVKSISLIYILEQFDKLKPTKDELLGLYSFRYTSTEILEAIDDLINKKYVVYLKVSNDYLRLKQSSGVDIKQQITDTIEKFADTFSVKDTLNNASIDNYMYPSKYNDEHEMIRYFSFIFIDSSEVKKNVDWEIKSEGIVADGIIYGIIPDSEDSISDLRESLLISSNEKKRFIFILPKEFSEIKDIVIQFNAVSRLRTLSEGDDLLFNEYEVIYEDLHDVISKFISSYTHPEYFRSIYIHNGEDKRITRKAGLSELMSEICDEVFPLTPIINNEAINKSELTGIAYTSRNKLISGLLRNTLESNLGLMGTGQEVSMMRSTLIRKNILVTDDKIIRINLFPDDKNMAHMLAVISNFIKSASNNNGSRFSDLYNELMLPVGRIGIRKPLILIYLAAVLHEYHQEIVILNDMGQVPLNTDTLLRIEANPALFRIQYLGWDSEKESYIKELEEIFKDYVVDAEKAINSYDYVVSAMKRWFMALPKYSKEKNPENKAKRYKGLIKLLKQNIGSYDFLFEKLPHEFGQETVDLILVDNIRAARNYYDRVLDDLIEQLISLVKEIFGGDKGKKFQKRASLASIIKDWCDGLNSAVFDQLFENGADRCIDLLKNVTNDEKTFIIRLAKLITDLRVEDWDSKTVDLFCKKLKEYKLTAEEFRSESNNEKCNNTNAYSFTYIDRDGSRVTKNFSRVEESKRGEFLMRSIVYDIEAMGNSISEQEKRQILMEVLRKLC